MKLRTYSRTALTLLLAFWLTAAALPAPPAFGQDDAPPPGGKGNKLAEYLPGEVLVRFRPGAEAADIPVKESREMTLPAMRVLGREVGTIAARIENVEGFEILEGLRLARVRPEDTLRAVAAFNARPDVLYAEPNYIWRTQALPNDTRLGDLWALRNTGQVGFNDVVGAQQAGTPGEDIDAELAWNTTTGSQSVVVAVIDEGIDITHGDLAPNIWTNPLDPLDGIDNDGNGFADDSNGWDFHNNNRTVYDGTPDDPTTPNINESEIDSHGTHVAGIIGARGNNGRGVVGVNWQVSIMSLKAIGPDGGLTSNFIKAYNYVKGMRDRGINVRVINNSYGGIGFSQSSFDAISRLNDAGVLFVAASGNDALDNYGFPKYPSDYDLPNVLNVAATDRFGQMAVFSNFGARAISIGAPGRGILSTTPHNFPISQVGSVDPDGSTYDFFSGTSMATPEVSGAAALLLSVFPNISVKNLRGALAFSGDLLPSLQGKTTTGRRLNVNKALQSAVDSTAPAAPADFHITSQSGRSVTFAWTAPGDDGGSGTASDYDFFFITTTGTRLLLPTTLLPAVAFSAQSATVTLPYRNFSGTVELRTYDDAGNTSSVTAPVTLTQNAATDPYVVTQGAAEALSAGGTPLGMVGDDVVKDNVALPFAFPYFGTTKTTVNVSTNGALYFTPVPRKEDGTGDDSFSSVIGLRGQAIIAGLWDDLRTDKGGNVFMLQPGPGRVIFRWQAVTFNTPLTATTSRGENPVNFEIELRSDGTIITRYGAAQTSPTNTKLFPVVGIGSGEPDAYGVATHTSEFVLKSLTNAPTVTFSPRPSGGTTTPTVQLDTAAASVSEGASSVTVNVTRTDASAPGSVEYATSGGTADSAKDYTLLLGRLDFAAGETTKPLTVLLTDDVFAEGSETLQLTLSNAVGMALGTPSSATITVTDNDSVTGLSPVRNEAFNANFFVRQHYLDFFSREPDAGGLAHWTNVANGCGDSDLLVCRINVSGAFFLSTEFEQTGYLVERAYKAAYGNATGNSTLGGTAHTLPVPIIRFEEFLPDTQRIGRGVVVLAPGWEALLESNKQAYFLEFVQRPRFTADYPAVFSPAQFVDQLNTRAGGPLDATERQALINELTANNTTSGRASVLRKVAEDASLFGAERNRAFVLMQYFGYLRRNPNGGQDTDHTGYEFWLNNLNNFNGNFVQAELVKAFITSDEYIKRFGN
jgi:subtilisin family serine protease